MEAQSQVNQVSTQENIEVQLVNEVSAQENTENQNEVVEELLVNEVSAKENTVNQQKGWIEWGLNNIYSTGAMVYDKTHHVYNYTKDTLVGSYVNTIGTFNDF